MLIESKIKMSNVSVNDIFDELFNENKRLLNELKFAKKCVEVLNEIKVFFDSNSNEIKLNLVSNQLKVFNDLCETIDKIIEQKNSFTDEVKEESIEETTNPKNSLPNENVAIFKKNKRKNLSKGVRLTNNSHNLGNIQKRSKMFSCGECDLKFKTKNNLEFHKQFRHKFPDETEVCDIDGCNEHFMSKESLETHKLVISS